MIILFKWRNKVAFQLSLWYNTFEKRKNSFQPYPLFAQADNNYEIIGGLPRHVGNRALIIP